MLFYFVCLLICPLVTHILYFLQSFFIFAAMVPSCTPLWQLPRADWCGVDHPSLEPCVAVDVYSQHYFCNHHLRDRIELTAETAWLACLRVMWLLYATCLPLRHAFFLQCVVPYPYYGFNVGTDRQSVWRQMVCIRFMWGFKFTSIAFWQFIAASFWMPTFL